MSFFLMERDGKANKVVAPHLIEIEPYILNIMEKDKTIGFIPLIFLRNLKQKDL